MRVYVNDFLLGSQSQNRQKWLKNRLIKDFNIKNLGKAKIIIKWEVIQNVQAQMLKIDHKS